MISPKHPVNMRNRSTQGVLMRRVVRVALACALVAGAAAQNCGPVVGVCPGGACCSQFLWWVLFAPAGLGLCGGGRGLWEQGRQRFWFWFCGFDSPPATNARAHARIHPHTRQFSVGFILLLAWPTPQVWDDIRALRHRMSCGE
jgi:hypothetical protein